MSRAILVLFSTFLWLSINAQYGNPDPNFNNNDLGRNYGDGIPYVAISLGGGGAIDPSGSDGIILPNGKMIIAGPNKYYNGALVNTLFRLKPDGTLDSTFSVGIGPDINGGTAAPNGYTSGIRRQNDDKLIVIGRFNFFNGVSRKNIARLNSDGSLDNFFNPTFPANLNISYAEPLSTGKILVGGNLGGGSPYLVRLNNDGSFDNSFQLSPSVTYGYGSKIIVQQDGKILINASRPIIGPTISRLLSDGSIDVAFVSMGPVTDLVNTFAQQPDGKVVYVVDTFAANNAYIGNWLKRLNVNGSQDVSFNRTLTSNNLVDDGTIERVMALGNGKIIVSGSLKSWNGTKTYNSVRLNSDGSFDNSFQSDINKGPVVTLDTTADGKILVGGGFGFEQSKNFLRRLNRDGKTDSSFNAGTGVNGRVYSISQLNDGRRIVAGSIVSYNGSLSGSIFRIFPNGDRDYSFKVPISQYRAIYSTAIQADGRVLIAGDFKNPDRTIPDTISPNLVRLMPDGSVDPSFSTDAKVDGNAIYAVAVQPDGKILIGGDFTHYKTSTSKGIVRLNSDGTLDATFQSGNGAAIVEAIVVQPDSKILIGGLFTSYNGSICNNFARLNSNGNFDATFQPGTGPNGEVFMLRQQTDGRIMACGNFTSYNGISSPRLVRINSDGSKDASFNIGTGPNNLIYCFAIRSDGTTAVGGPFTSFNGSPAQRIVLLDVTGNTLSTFSTSNGSNNTVDFLHFESDGNLLAGGAFTSYAGTGRNRLARLLAPSAVTAVSNLQDAGLISLSPVPARDYLLIEAGRRGVRMGLRLLDMNGRLVRDFGTFTNSTRISVSSLPSGQYFIELTDGRSKQKSIRSFIH